MRIVVLAPRGVTFAADSPWFSFLSGLRAAGHEVAGFGVADTGAHALVTLNDQPAARRLIKDLDIPASRAALVMLEPRVTAPSMYTAFVLEHYGHRFAPSPLWARQVGAEQFLWPQVVSTPPVSGVDWEFAATMINAEKRSAISGSLYGLRREVIRACDSRRIPLAVFGPGWDSPPGRRLWQGVKAMARALRARQLPHVVEALRSPAIQPTKYLGTIDDKASAFAVAPSAIIIENSRDYISEKLFDALSAGVAPIYVGPPLETFGIPANIAVECEPDASSIARVVATLSEYRRSEITDAGREWLVSAAAQRHEITHVLTDLGRTVGERLRS